MLLSPHGESRDKVYSQLYWPSTTSIQNASPENEMEARCAQRAKPTSKFAPSRMQSILRMIAVYRMFPYRIVSSALAATIVRTTQLP